jgi:hypothetical protein
MSGHGGVWLESTFPTFILSTKYNTSVSLLISSASNILCLVKNDIELVCTWIFLKKGAFSSKEMAPPQTLEHLESTI